MSQVDVGLADMAKRPSSGAERIGSGIVSENLHHKRDGQIMGKRYPVTSQDGQVVMLQPAPRQVGQPSPLPGPVIEWLSDHRPGVAESYTRHIREEARRQGRAAANEILAAAR